MLNLSQNNKIAISAIAVFLISFAAMLFFLENSGSGLEHGQINVLDAEGEESSVEDFDAVYRSHLKDKDAPLFVTNAEGGIQYASEDFCKLIGVRCDDLTETTLFDHINSADLSDLVSDHTGLIQSAEAKEGVGPYRIKQGKDEILVLFNAYPILDAKGKVSEIVFSVKDLTKQIEELNQNGIETDKNQKKIWLERLYPKINEMKDDAEIRMMVDKIS